MALNFAHVGVGGRTKGVAKQGSRGHASERLGAFSGFAVKMLDYDYAEKTMSEGGIVS